MICLTCNAEALDRVAFWLGPTPIYWYGVIIASGLFLGLYIASKESNRLGLQKDLIVDLIVFAAPIAIISARIYYVIFTWDVYQDAPWYSVFAIWEGGIAIHGALIGSVLTAIVFAKVKKVSFWQVADIVAPSLILGQAIGRWGNFMNQEAHGGPVSEAAYNNFIQYLPNFINNQMCIDGVMYHPTFLYESLWNFAIFGGLLYLRKRNLLRGEMFLTYIVTYSIGRAFIEMMRTDSLMFGPLKQAVLLSIVLIIGAIALAIYRRKDPSVDRLYDGTKVNTKRKK